MSNLTCFASPLSWSCRIRSVSWAIRRVFCSGVRVSGFQASFWHPSSPCPSWRRLFQPRLFCTVSFCGAASGSACLGRSAFGFSPVAAIASRFLSLEAVGDLAFFALGREAFTAVCRWVGRSRFLCGRTGGPLRFGLQLGHDLGNPSEPRIADHRQHFRVVAEENSLQQARLVRAVAVAIALTHRSAEQSESVGRERLGRRGEETDCRWPGRCNRFALPPRSCRRRSPVARHRTRLRPAAAAERRG